MNPLTCLILMAIGAVIAGGGFWFGLRTAYRQLRGQPRWLEARAAAATVATQRRTLRPRADIRCALAREPR